MHLRGHSDSFLFGRMFTNSQAIDQHVCIFVQDRLQISTSAVFQGYPPIWDALAYQPKQSDSVGLIEECTKSHRYSCRRAEEHFIVPRQLGCNPPQCAQCTYRRTTECDIDENIHQILRPSSKANVP